MGRSIWIVVALSLGCSAHLGPDYGQTTRRAFGVQAEKKGASPSVAFDGIDAQNAIIEHHAPPPSAQNGGAPQSAPGFALPPLSLGGKP
jgi:hypothetical protein